MKKMIVFSIFMVMSNLAFSLGCWDNTADVKARTTPSYLKVKESSYNGYYGPKITLQWGASPEYDVITFTGVGCLFTPGLDDGARFLYSYILVIQKTDTNPTTYNFVIDKANIEKIMDALTSGNYTLSVYADYSYRRNQLNHALYSNTQIKSIKIDATPPPVPSGFKLIEDPQDNFITNNGKTYTSGKYPIKFIWSPSIDTQSGLQGYKLYLTYSDFLSHKPYHDTIIVENDPLHHPTDFSSLTSFFHEGYNKFYLSAIDFLGNESEPSEFGFYLDYNGPNDVQNFTSQVNSIKNQQGEIESQNIRLDWDPVTLDNPTTLPNCAVRGYQLCWRLSDFNVNPEALSIIEINKDAITYPIDISKDNFSERGKYYTFFIRSIDNVSNPSDHWSESKLYIPKEPLNISNVTYHSSSLVGGTPEYPYRIEFDQKPEEYFFTDDTKKEYSLKSVKLTLADADGQNEMPLIECDVTAIINSNGVPKSPWLIAPDGNLAISLKLQNAIAAHRTYRFNVYTVHNGIDLIEKGSSFTADPTPNIPPAFDVIVKDAAGIQLGRVDQDGYIPGTGTPLRLYTNSVDGVYFSLETPYGGGKDGEGDVLKFKLLKIDKTSLGESWSDNRADSNDGKINFATPASAIYHLYISAEEYTSNIGAAEQSLLDVYSGDYQSFPTLHNNGQEGFYIYFDFNAGEGVFEVKSLDETKTLDTNVPTNTENVKVFIRQNAITDKLQGPVDAGIAAVYLWNCPLAGFPNDLTNLPAVIASHRNDPSITKIDLGITTEPSDPMGFAPVSDITRPWQLAPTGTGPVESDCLVVMEVIDKAGAGNVYYFWKVVLLDKKPPSPPQTVAHSYSVSDPQLLHITWKAGDGCVAYSYSINDGVLTNALAREILINTSRYPPNAPIFLKIWGIDAAGNVSAYPYNYTPFTPATLGAVTPTEDEYSEALGHYFKWTIDGGTAASFALEQLNPDDTIAASISFINGDCIQSGLFSHETRTYRLVAINGSNDRTVGLKLPPRMLKNNPPTAPVSVSPAGFTKASVKLRWNQAMDVDGDPLIYNVSIRETGQINYTIYHAGNSFQYPSDNSTLSFADGKTYYFKVAAIDDYAGTTDNEETSFTVDALSPSIAFTALPNPSQPPAEHHVSVNISDTASGLDSACYWTSDGMQGSTANPIMITLTKGVQTVSADISVHEGEYTITVKAVDIAGNENEKTSGVIATDQTKPQITNAAVLLNRIVDGRQASSGAVPITISCRDDYSGIKNLLCGFTDSAGGAVSTWTPLTLESMSGSNALNLEKHYALTLSAPPENGRTSYLVLKVLDWAGNESDEWRDSSGILVDSTKPEVSLAVTGYAALWQSNYIRSIDQLAVSGSYTENDTPVISVLYAVVREGTSENEIEWKTDYETAKNTSYADGAAYRVEMKVTNAIGLSSTAKSVLIIYDSSGALNLAVTGLSPTAYVPGEELRFTANGKEPDTAIASYRVAIGTTDDATAFSKNLNGHVNGWLVVNSNQSSASFTCIVPPVPNGNYRLRLEMVNASGIVSALAYAGAIRVDDGAEKVVVNTMGDYSSSSDSFTFFWNYRGERHPVAYEYRVLNADGSALTAWASTPETRVLVSGLTLVNGASYTFEVTAHLDSEPSVTGRSLGVTVDDTPPSFDNPGGLITPLAATSDGVTLSYHAVDGESGLSKVEVLIEKYDADNNRLDIGGGWINLLVVYDKRELNLLADAQGRPLALATGDKIYITMRATNGALLEADAYAPAIVVDDTRPPLPLIIDQGDALNTTQYPRASWLWSKEDPESGTAFYEWTIMRSPAEVDGATWYPAIPDAAAKTYEADVEQTLGSSFQIAHLDTWYFAVRAVNGAGLDSIGVSNGIIYDQTAPFLATMRLMQGGQEALYLKDFSGATVRIEAIEDATKITRYDALPGTWNTNGGWVPSAGGNAYSSVSGTMPVDNPAPSTAPGEILVFRGASINQAGLVSESGYTKGALVYSQAPGVKNVRARVIGLSIYADWEDVPSELPVLDYLVELRPINISGQTSVNLSTIQKNVIIDGSGLPAGRYQVRVKARSLVDGMPSDWSESPDIFIDLTPPVVTSLRTPPYASKSVTMRIEARDDESGLAEYQYAIGTSTDADAFTIGYVSFMNASGSVFVTVNFSELASGLAGVIDGSVLYTRVKVRNANGLWSEERLSTPIIIDKSAPDIPAVTVANPYTRYANKIEGIGVKSRDLQSGLTSVAFAVTSDASEAGLAVAQWKEALLPDNTFHLDASNQTAIGLALKQGDMVYVAVKTKNGAGDWSAAGLSPLVKADLAAPQIEFTSGQDVIVVNDAPLNVPYRITEDVSSTVDVIFTLVAPDGSSETATVSGLVPGNYQFSFGNTAYGNYELQATAQDQAGNESVKSVQKLRVNAPVLITLYDIDTTPGKPLVLKAIILDSDGEPRYGYLWKFGNGTADSTEANPIHRFYQSEKYAQKSTYTVSLEVTDSDGKKSNATCKVTVENTREGQLYTDEYWSGTHNIIGNVVVPRGISLSVLDNTSVLAGNVDLLAFDVRLTIEGRLITGNGARFTLAGEASTRWNGIVVKGEAVLDNATIEKAKRGLTVIAGGNVSLHNATFSTNEIGLHVLGTLTIDACTFTGNKLYGIKEDGQASPTVLNCVFDGNAYDYYHRRLTVISATEINNIPGNSGNRKK